MAKMDRDRADFMDRDRAAMIRSKSANAYSPARERDDYIRRQAWGPSEEEMIANQMSFGRDKYEREARFAMGKENFREDYRKAPMGSSSPLRRSPAARSRSFGKNVQFAQ